MSAAAGVYLKALWDIPSSWAPTSPDRAASSRRTAPSCKENLTTPHLPSPMEKRFSTFWLSLFLFYIMYDCHILCYFFFCFLFFWGQRAQESLLSLGSVYLFVYIHVTLLHACLASASISLHPALQTPLTSACASIRAGVSHLMARLSTLNTHS